MRRYRSYKFTNKKHSQDGVRSSIAAGISLVCTVLSVYGAYAEKGNAGTYLALLGFLAIASCVYGAFTGNKSFKEEDCYYLFSRIGLTVNMVLLVFWIAVFAVGFLI